MEPTAEQLAALKNIEISILREFVNICEKLNLQYYLLGGTMLGAVRHRGFIPWDDDIDVGMPRQDYELFLAKGQQLLPSNLFIQNDRTDPEYIMCFSKIRNCDTTFIETSARTFNINHGVFIDVFPLDYYPEDDQEQKRFERKKGWYERRLSCCFNMPHNHTIKGRVRKLLLTAMFPSAKAVVRKREQLYRSVPESSMLANYGGAWGKKEIVPVEWYGSGTTVMFEGLQVKAPCQYDKWLSQVYGNYMQLPPIEKQVGHHYTDVIDLEKPYTEYVRSKR